MAGDAGQISMHPLVICDLASNLEEMANILFNLKERVEKLETGHMGLQDYQDAMARGLGETLQQMEERCLAGCKEELRKLSDLMLAKVAQVTTVAEHHELLEEESNLSRNASACTPLVRRQRSQSTPSIRTDVRIAVLRDEQASAQVIDQSGLACATSRYGASMYDEPCQPLRCTSPLSQSWWAPGSSGIGGHGSMALPIGLANTKQHLPSDARMTSAGRSNPEVHPRLNAAPQLATPRQRQRSGRLAAQLTGAAAPGHVQPLGHMASPRQALLSGQPVERLVSRMQTQGIPTAQLASPRQAQPTQHALVSDQAPLSPSLTPRQVQPGRRVLASDQAPSSFSTRPQAAAMQALPSPQPGMESSTQQGRAVERAYAVQRLVSGSVSL